MKEIELKAHIDDIEETETLVRSFARFVNESVKYDIYWLSDIHPVKLRIREEGTKTFVTYKRKQLNDNIEVNDEIELEISDKEAFEFILQELGFSVISHKEKEVKAFIFEQEDKPPVLIELCLVKDLGWFLEIEISLTNPDKTEIQEAKQELLKTLKRCGISEYNIEKRFYSDLLELRFF